MRNVLFILLAIGGMTGFAAWADEEFGEELESKVPQEVVVPQSGTSVVSQEEYLKALQQAQLRGQQPDLRDQLLKQADEYINIPLPTGVEQLPFGLLSEELDKDQDGVSDQDEVKLVTDPGKADTDGDGYIDGLEVVRGYNPTVPSPGDKISYQEPAGEELLLAGEYQVTGVRLGDGAGQQLLTVTGTGPDLSLVVLLVISDNSRWWITRTDETGRFLYVSADTLDVGSYKIYAAAVSADGVPREVSLAYEFDRQAEGVVFNSPSPTPLAIENVSSINLMSLTILMVGAVVVLVIMGVIIWVRRHKKIT